MDSVLELVRKERRKIKLEEKLKIMTEKLEIIEKE